MLSIIESGQAEKSMNLIQIDRIRFIKIMNTVLPVGECRYEHLICGLWT